MKLKLSLATAALFLAGVARADSDYVYTYVGNQLANSAALGQQLPATVVPNVAPCNCSLDGWLSVSGIIPLPIPLQLQQDTIPLDWSFTDGDYTLTPQNSTINAFYTGVSAIFTGQTENDWALSILGTGAFSSVEFDISPDEFRASCVCTGWDEVLINGQVVAIQLNDPGLWTETRLAPEPSTLPLLALGLAVMVWPRKKAVRV
jgi:hypothetical protein